MVSMNTPDEGCRAQSQRIARTFPNPYRDPSRATERTQPLIVTIPELGTVKAAAPPIVIVTSNRTREVHDALKRRCLYHWVSYPNAERELKILRAKLPLLEGWTARRRDIARMYDELIRDPEVVKPPLEDPVQHVFHLYVLRHTQRDRLMSHLEQCGVGTAAHYPVPIHLQHAYADLGFGPGAFPVAEAAASQVVSLPIFPQLTDDEVAYVAESVDSFGG